MIRRRAAAFRSSKSAATSASTTGSRRLGGSSKANAPSGSRRFSLRFARAGRSSRRRDVLERLTTRKRRQAVAVLSDVAPRLFRIEFRELAQRPADRLAQPELAPVERWFDASVKQVAVGVGLESQLA